MSPPSTNIRVFVQWTEQTVFAGEDIECQITFKNVAESTIMPKAPLNPAAASGFALYGEKQRKSPAPQARSSLNPRPPPPKKGHRTTLSLNTPFTAERSPSGPGPWAGIQSKVPTSGKPHKRSVSIISIGASGGAVDDVTTHWNAVDGSRRMSRGHGRSASLQIVPRRHGINGGLPSGWNIAPSSKSKKELTLRQHHWGRGLLHILHPLFLLHSLPPAQMQLHPRGPHNGKLELPRRQAPQLLLVAPLQGRMAQHHSHKALHSPLCPFLQRMLNHLPNLPSRSWSTIPSIAPVYYPQDQNLQFRSFPSKRLQNQRYSHLQASLARHGVVGNSIPSVTTRQKHLHRSIYPNTWQGLRHMEATLDALRISYR